MGVGQGRLRRLLPFAAPWLVLLILLRTEVEAETTEGYLLAAIAAAGTLLGVVRTVKDLEHDEQHVTRRFERISDRVTYRTLRDRWRDRHTFLWYLIASLSVGLGLTLVLALMIGVRENASVIPMVRLDADYTASLHCRGACDTWGGREQLVVVVPEAVREAGVDDKLSERLESDGWQREEDVTDLSRMTYTRNTLSKRFTLGPWLRTSQDLDLPHVFDRPFTSVPIDLLVEASRGGAMGGRTFVGLSFGKDSRIDLTYPKRAVYATNPPSQPSEATKDLESRSLKLDNADLDGAKVVTLEVVAEVARNTVVNRLVGLSLMDLLLMGLVGLGAMLFTPVREAVLSVFKTFWTLVGRWALRVASALWRQTVAGLRWCCQVPGR